MLLLAAIFPIVVQAQIDREVRRSVKVYFRQGSAILDENYMGNKATLQEFAAEVKSYCQDTTAHFRQIHVVASASPEGGKLVNDRLARLRAEAITKWVSNHISIKLDYAVESLSIDWQNLIEMISQNDDVPYRDEVLELLRNTPEYVERGGVMVQERYEQFSKLQNGVPYAWIYRNLFPRMRYASARAEFWWEAEPYLFIKTKSPINFGAEGGNGVITFEKSFQDDVIPAISCPVEWIKSIVLDGNNVKFKVDPNPKAEARSTAITLDCYGKKQNVIINQEAAKPVLSITSISPMEFVAAGGDGVITFEKNVVDDVVPIVKCDADWIESLSASKDGASFKVATNELADPRTATIVVECYGQSHEVVVNQQADNTKCRHPFYMAIKNNMLYDLVLVPNIGVEFYLGKNWSIVANWHYSWWKTDRKHWYWRTYGGDLALRYWLGEAAKRKPLTGHHLGAYGQIITYDFETGNKGYLADRWSWSAGVEYGYSLPIARRLNIDFTIGVGYHKGDVKKYLPIDGHYVWQSTERRQYVGPTKLEVSLAWLIGCGNYNDKKGGKR